MNTLFEWLLPQNFMPHGHCYLWRPDVLWLHVSSDAVIAASYYAIPVALAHFVHRRRAVLPYWWVPVLFAMFIFLCGTTHVLNIWTVWRADYIVDGLVKLATAVASASTAVLVFASLPQALALRTPIELQAEVDARTADLRATNQRLRQEIAAREENEMRMRLALEASGAATWLIDYTKAANEHFDARSCQLAGLDAARTDWPAGTFCKLLHPDDREQMQLASQQTHAMAGPGPVLEYRIVTSRQEVRWLQGAGIVQRNTQGEPERFIGVSIDITDRKRLESQLLHNIERLALADRRKDEFLATLAHELRNPLAPIGNGLQILKLVAPADERLRRTTDVMERQLSHLLRLVDDLLDLSRIARGKAQLRKEPLAINGVLARALESCAQLIEARQLELRVRMGTESLWVNGDSDRLMQVFSNLLSNAAKYTEEGGHIDVALEHRNGKVIVRVKDTGIGIPPESLDTVFELFSQLRPPAHGDGGLGIGLALVRQLVQRHGGTVEAHSGGCGQGSEFIVRLPATTAPSTASRAAPEQPAAPLLSPRRVLVVDDNTDAAESLKSLLMVLGHEVRVAEDGVQAIETARSFDPHVIFMDIDMPRLNGVDAARRIRELALAHQPVIVALTGLGQEADRERSRKAAIDYHIVKPIDRQSLDHIFAGAGKDLSSDRETRAGITSSLSSESSIPAQSPGSPLLAQRID